MNVTSACNFLNLSGTVSHAEIKKAYKAAALKFHPDRNPAGEKMMVALNEAYEYLCQQPDPVIVPSHHRTYDYGSEFNDILIALGRLPGIHIEVCGNWVWVTGDTKPLAKVLGRDGLGLMYSSKKTAWYYRPDEYKSRSRQSMSMSEIRERHGSMIFERDKRQDKHIN